MMYARIKTLCSVKNGHVTTWLYGGFYADKKMDFIH